MAKPLGEKSKLIRDAITKHPEKSNKDIAEMLTDSADCLDDKLESKPTDVAQQRQAMKKVPAAAPVTTPAQADQETPAQAAPEPEPTRPAVNAPHAAPEKPKGNGRRTGRPKGPTNAKAPRVAPAPQTGAVELVDKVFDLAKKCGGFASLNS